MAITLPLVSAWSSTPSSARNVPVETTVSTNEAGAMASIDTVAAAASGRAPSWLLLGLVGDSPENIFGTPRIATPASATAQSSVFLIIRFTGTEAEQRGVLLKTAPLRVTLPEDSERQARRKLPTPIGHCLRERIAERIAA